MHSVDLRQRYVCVCVCVCVQQMITSIALAKVFIISYSYQSYVVIRIFKTCSLNFQAYIIELLAIIIMLHIISQNLIYLIAESQHPIQHLPISPTPAPGNQSSTLSKALSLKEKEDYESHNATVKYFFFYFLQCISICTGREMTPDYSSL